MEKLKSTLPNMVLSLVSIALITAAVLAFVNHLTQPAISAKAELSLANGIKEVMGNDNLKVASADSITTDNGGKTQTFVVHNCTDQEGTMLGAAVESTTLAFGGDLKVLVGFTPEGEVLGYKVLLASETPGLGAKADKWFQKDGKGCIVGRKMTDGDLHVSKDEPSGNAVDAITASTITSRAFLKAVNEAFQAYSKKNVEGVSGASKVKKDTQKS